MKGHKILTASALISLMVLSPAMTQPVQATTSPTSQSTSSSTTTTQYKVVTRKIRTDNGYSNSSVASVILDKTTYMDIDALETALQKFGVPNYINGNNWFLNETPGADAAIQPIDTTKPISVYINGKFYKTIHLIFDKGKTYFPIWYLMQAVQKMGSYASWNGQELSLSKYPPAHSIVNPNQTYTYTIMQKDIQKLAAMYPDLVKYEVVGKTVYGRNIYAVSLGKGPATVFINGSHHAREWITTTLNMYMIDQYALAYRKNTTISGYNVRKILNNTTIWFMPMVNPDGVTLEQFGAGAFPKSVRKQLIKWNDGSTNFSRWKSNAQGIDPNRQYDGGWRSIPAIVKGPHYKTYKGTKPFQINEVKAVVDLVKKINAQEEISYHASGGVIYWGYQISKANYDKFHSLAKKIGKLTGYPVTMPPASQTGGGMTDWWTHNIGRPGFTIEVGPPQGERPVPLKYFSSIWKQNRTVGLELAIQGFTQYQAHPHSVLH